MYQNERENAVTQTIRGVRRSLASAMDIRAHMSGLSREKMLLELLGKEFEKEEKTVLQSWDAVKDRTPYQIVVNGGKLYKFPFREDAETLARGFASQGIKCHLISYEDGWFVPFDGNLKWFDGLPHKVVTTFEMDADGTVKETLLEGPFIV